MGILIFIVYLLLGGITMAVSSLLDLVRTGTTANFSFPHRICLLLFWPIVAAMFCTGHIAGLLQTEPRRKDPGSKVWGDAQD